MGCCAALMFGCSRRSVPWWCTGSESLVLPLERPGLRVSSPHPENIKHSRPHFHHKSHKVKSKKSKWILVSKSEVVSVITQPGFLHSKEKSPGCVGAVHQMEMFLGGQKTLGQLVFGWAESFLILRQRGEEARQATFSEWLLNLFLLVPEKSQKVCCISNKLQIQPCHKTPTRLFALLPPSLLRRGKNCWHKCEGGDEIKRPYFRAAVVPLWLLLWEIKS